MMMRWLFAAALAAGIATGASAEAIKIGGLHTTGNGPVYIAAAKGYFAAEGLEAQLVYFESAQPIAVATASGDIDIAYTGLTGGFYGLASQGVLRIVAGGARETPGFHYQPFLVSNHAWDEGLRAFAGLPGHSFGVSQIGSPPHYALGLIAEKYKFDVKTVRIQPLASIPNLVAGIVGGQVDSVMMPGNTAVPVLRQGQAKLLG
jgi:NitT/TauT family transport system substrate-binding protein